MISTSPLSDQDGTGSVLQLPHVAGQVAAEHRAEGLFPSPQPSLQPPGPSHARLPTKIEAFVLVFGVEEDPLGVRIDISTCCYEHCCDVSLAPLDGDVQCRLPCKQNRHGAQEPGTTLSYSQSPLTSGGGT